MFSLDRFYHILHDNLISNFVNSKSFYFHPFGTYDAIATIDPYSKTTVVPYLEYNERRNLLRFEGEKTSFYCHFYDQEPLFPETPYPIPAAYDDTMDRQRRVVLIANSEKSEFKNEFVKRNKYHHDWYYFFHGFAALDWYRDFQYFDSKSFENFDKVFICYNHLISNYRSYRLHVIANIIENKLLDKGYVSFFLKDDYGTWQQAVKDPHTLLSDAAKIKIVKNVGKLKAPLIIDTDSPNGSMSAGAALPELTKALWHVVTETIYFQPKLHLTEKIFKPIVAKRPFLLVAAPGNLAYLKSYGFKTFDRWIDESYDNETDNFKRIEMITAELTKLCSLSKAELKQMHSEMQEILEYNHQHFYGEFKKIIVNELVDNFCWILARINNGRIPNNHSRYHCRFDLPEGHAELVKRRLLL